MTRSGQRMRRVRPFSSEGSGSVCDNRSGGISCAARHFFPLGVLDGLFVLESAGEQRRVGTQQDRAWVVEALLGTRSEDAGSRQKKHGTGYRNGDKASATSTDPAATASPRLQGMRVGSETGNLRCPVLPAVPTSPCQGPVEL